MRKKIITVIGTRPELIKVAPLIKELKLRPNLDLELVLTGQHTTIMEPLLSHFELKADRILAIDRVTGSLAELVGLVSIGMGGLISQSKPDAILVHGDTTSAMACAICGFNERVPVFHLEAGLRSFDMEQPFPEEFNRRVISLAAALNFAPTKNSKENLLRDGVPPTAIHVVGNTVIDALFWTLDKQRSNVKHFPEGKFGILITCHRRESWGEQIENVCKAVLAICQKSPHVHALFPMHPNPAVRRTVESVLAGQPNVELCEPMGYSEFCSAMKDCDLIITDSGGIQEEALALAKPTLVTRSKTERPEVLEWNTVKLVGTDSERIEHECAKLVSDKAYYDSCAVAAFPFGDGNSSKLIASAIESFWQSTNKEST